MQTQAHKAPRVLTIAEKEIQRQEEIFQAARKVKDLRAKVRAREERDTRYLWILRTQLAKAEAEFTRLTGEAIAQAVRS